MEYYNLCQQYKDNFIIVGVENANQILSTAFFFWIKSISIGSNSSKNKK